MGTLNVFEAARDLRDQVRCVSYASSAAVFGPEDAYGPDESLTDAARLEPTGIAWRVSDSGLREVLGSVPHTPLEQGIADTIARFRGLLARGALDTSELPAAA